LIILVWHLEFLVCFQTPLHLAVLTQQHHIVRALLVAGASPDSRDRHGNTALHLASDQGLTKCVHALLQPVTVEETSNSGLVFTVPRYISKPALLEELNYDGEYQPVFGFCLLGSKCTQSRFLSHKQPSLLAISSWLNIMFSGNVILRWFREWLLTGEYLMKKTSAAHILILQTNNTQTTGG
jgi:hypothetical protein